MKKNKLLTILFCFSIALFGLLICSKCSPFYPLNDWVDANAFFTTGKAMVRGIVPYKDLFEQKGPFLYLIYGLGSLISYKSFWGVFCLEVINLTVFLYYVYKIIALFLEQKYAYLIIPILTFLMLTSYAFTHGGGAEEFCLAFFGLSLYHFLKHFQKEEISYKQLLLNGFIAGLIAMTKFTLLGFWFIFMASIFFSLIYDKKYKKAFLACLIFLGGMSIPIILFLIYFLINKGLKDFVDVYFLFNMTNYGDVKTSLWVRLTTLIKGLLGAINSNNKLLGGFLFILSPFMILFLNLKKSGKIAYFFLYLFTILGIYFGLRFYRYYFFPLEIFILISLIGLFYLLHKRVDLTKYKLSYFIVVILFILISFNNANYKDMLFLKKEDLFQYRFLDKMTLDKESTLLNMGYLDCGLYTTSGIIPSTYYFQVQNISYEAYPKLYDEMQNYVKNKKIKYVVYFTTKNLEYVQENEKNLWQNYHLIAEARQKFQSKKRNIFLFERN